MPRRSVLSVIERDSLLALPENQDDLIRYYTFSEADLSIIRQHRGAANRLGFAIQLCTMRYPGILLTTRHIAITPLLNWVCKQLNIEPSVWQRYAQRAETRREHRLELQAVFGFKPFTMKYYQPAVHSLQ